MEKRCFKNMLKAVRSNETGGSRARARAKGETRAAAFQYLQDEVGGRMRA
jgi:hypothetical protein